MLKKIFLSVCLLVQTSVFANYNDILVVDIQYDWINKAELEKESIISEVQDILFEKPVEKIPDFKLQFQDKLKDKNYKEHYLAASAGYKEYGDYNIAAFYYKKMKHIYMYALQDK